MIIIDDLGELRYDIALGHQQTIFDSMVAEKRNGKFPKDEHILLVEHSPVYTMGKHADEHNILFNRNALEKDNIYVYKTNRGGDVTFHGPGQLVAYPIIDLQQHKLGVKQYVGLLEQAVIDTIADYGITGIRDEGATGVWVSDNNGPRKICAIGVAVSRSITMHGLALNVNTDLSYFDRINPCGFTDRGVTSISKELGKNIDFNKVKQTFTDKILKLLN